MRQAQSQIVKSDRRGSIQNEFYNCFSVFNYLEFNDDSQTPFGKLCVFNEEILAPNQTIAYTVTEDQIVLLIPIVGSITIQTDTFADVFHTNEVLYFSSENQHPFSISNSSSADNVQFLQLRFKSTSSEKQKTPIELTSKNSILSIVQTEDFSVSIAVFDGRKEAEYFLQNNTNGVFAFVLNGAFEFQNRLLENRDGLKIWDIDSLEMEALSNDAIILIIEVSL